MQFIRDLCRTKKITAIQFRILVPLVDTSNEGTDGDRSRWGKSWLSLESLALESGCSKRAVEKNLPKLEAAGIVKVTRDLNDDGRSKGGRSNVNEYWLTGWNRFGAVKSGEEISEPGSLYDGDNSVRETGKQRMADQETANGGQENSERRAPDSTYRSHLEVPNQERHAASRRTRPAEDGRFKGGPNPKAANENAIFRPADHNWPEDWKEQFWQAYPDRKNVLKAEAKLISFAKAGLRLESILIAARRYDRYLGPEIGFCKDPVTWMSDEPWKGNAKHASRPKSKVVTAI